MRLILSNISGIPIYEQIKEQIKEAIVSGELQENDALPSLRSLARELKISVLTTTRAYTELEQEGFVKNIQGKGCYVQGRGSELVREQLIRDVEDGLSRAVDAARRAELKEEEVTELLKMLWEADEHG